MVRFLLFALIFALVYRLIALTRHGRAQKGGHDRVRDTPESRSKRSRPQDFDGMKIEDADFEDIED